MLKLHKIKCEICNKEFNIKCSDKNWILGKYRRTCSSNCAHKLSNIHSNILEKNAKISKSLKKDKKFKKCSYCGKNFIPKGKEKFCSNECKKMNNCSITLSKYFGYDLSNIGSNKAIEEFNRIKNLLYNDYWNLKMTSKEICYKYNYPNAGNITGKIFKYLNIPSRNCSDATKLNFLLGNLKPGNNYFYKSEWHTTWNNKEVYLRSSYEKDFALKLDNQKIDYNVESLRIKYYDSQTKNYRCAIPDFVVGNKIYEIKSKWTYDELNMKDKFKAYIELGYEAHLILEHKEIKI